MSVLSSIGSLPLLALRALKWKAYRGGWLADHLRHHRRFKASRLGRDVPIDVIFTLVDHFEPAIGKGPIAAAESVIDWCRQYREAATSYRDSDGLAPRHSWFYRSENQNDACLHTLCGAVFDGFGEIEFHLHHGHDDHESFRAKLDHGTRWFQRRGAMLTAAESPATRFAYIAGNWALDNGAGVDAYSGCNTELLALRKSGCYADFTFPALGSPAQPRKTNSIYFATDDPRPKSYNQGVDLNTGGQGTGDLVIFQGPLCIDWSAATFEDASLEAANPPASHRLNNWLSAHVHVRGRPEWIFVKLHTHGMQSRAAILGESMQDLWGTMQERWTAAPFRLHFATAREAYNMARAAASGHAGNPAEYRDFDIPAPANSRIWCDAEWKLLTYTADTVSLVARNGVLGDIRFRDLPVQAIRGAVRAVEIQLHAGRVHGIQIDGDGALEIDLPGGKQWRGTPDALDARGIHAAFGPGAQLDGSAEKPR